MALARISLALLAAGLRRELQYRMNFVTWILVGLVYQLTGFVFIWVVLARFESVGGWTLGDVAFLYGLRLVGHALSVAVFGHIHGLEWLVREGAFDRVLVRPIPPLLHLVTNRLPVGAIGDLSGGLVLFIAASGMVDVSWSPLAFGYLALAVAGGALIEGGIRFGIASMSFRFLRTSGLLFFVDGIFNNFGPYPLRIFGGAIEFALTFGLPVAFVAYLPASVLLERTHELSVQPLVAYLAPLAGIVVMALAYAVWRHELPRYQSSGH